MKNVFIIIANYSLGLIQTLQYVMKRIIIAIILVKKMNKMIPFVEYVGMPLVVVALNAMSFLVNAVQNVISFHVNVVKYVILLNAFVVKNAINILVNAALNAIMHNVNVVLIVKTSLVYVVKSAKNILVYVVLIP